MVSTKSNPILQTPPNLPQNPEIIGDINQEIILEAILRQAVNGIAVCNSKGKLILVNEAAQKMAVNNPDNTNLDTLPGLWGRAYDKEGRPIPNKRWFLTKALMGETTQNRTVRMVRPDGSECFLLMSASPVRNGKGEIVGAISTFIDITQRQLAEDEISRTHLFLDAIIENIPDMIFVKEAQDLRFVRFNKAGEELLGYKRGDLIGKNDHDFFPKNEADFFTQKDKEVLANGKVVDIPEEPIHTLKKGKRLLHTKKVPIVNSLGKPQYLLGISEDITERRRLEKEVIEASENERRRIGEDLHDGLGQHLLGISFLANILRKKMTEKNFKEETQLAERVEELLGQARTQTRELAKILYATELESNDLYQALQNLVISMASTSSVKCRLEGDSPVIIENPIDATSLFRIAQEALSNAVRHSQATEVVISTQYYPQNGNLTLSIRDNGVGISESTSGKAGLGLRIMRYRARMIGASMEIQKLDQGGTSVSIQFQNSRKKND